MVTELRPPEQPDYEAEEVLDWLYEEYELESESDWQEEFGMYPTEAINYVQNELERGEEDKERLKDEMRFNAMMDHELYTNAWTVRTEEEHLQEADERLCHNTVVAEQGEGNDEVYVIYREFEFV